MQLKRLAIDDIAAMICGNKDSRGECFPYRSSSFLTSFFADCELDYVHDGTTRQSWVFGVLSELNNGPATIPDLPADTLISVIKGVLDERYFERAVPALTREPAIQAMNKSLSREGLAVYTDDAGRVHVRATGKGAVSTMLPDRPRPLSKEELRCRARVAAFLEAASEDDFTEKVLVPLFQSLGFHRVSSAGHREKMLEFGKDLWMRFQLPTGHWLYFCAQVKRGKLDAARSSGSGNITDVLTQAKMAFGHAVFDPDVNRRVLLDHLFVIASGEVTRAAKSWLVERLDQDQRRQIIFMDRDEFLNHAGRILLHGGFGDEQVDESEIPF